MAINETELKLVIRGILISTPTVMTVTQLAFDYRNSEGMEFPYRLLGFSSLVDYLNSIPDTVRLDFGANRYNPNVLPVKSEKSSHIDSLVMRQRCNNNNKKVKYNRFAKPLVQRRRGAIEVKPLLVKTPTPPPAPLMGYNHHGGTTNVYQRVFHKPADRTNVRVEDQFRETRSSHPIYTGATNRNRTVPWEIINLINYLCTDTTGVTFQDVDRTLRKEFAKAGISGVNEIRCDLFHYFTVRNNRVYRKSTGRPIFLNMDASATQVAEAALASPVPPTNDDGGGSSSSKWESVWLGGDGSNANCIPAGSEATLISGGSSGGSDSESSSKYSRTRRKEQPPVYVTAERAEPAVDNHVVYETDLIDEAEEGECDFYESDKMRTSPHGADGDDDDDDGTMISSRMKSNLRSLVNAYSEGIQCSDLPGLYQKEFGCSLNYEDYGYDCVFDMVSALKKIFILKREQKNSDWTLLSASNPDARIISQQNDLSAKSKIWISREIINNIVKVLQDNPAGVEINDLCRKYLDCHGRKLEAKNIGFKSVESLVDNLEEHVHRRKVREKTLLYAKCSPNLPSSHGLSKLKPPKQCLTDASGAHLGTGDNDFQEQPPLPDDDKLNTILKSLFPDEVCGPDAKYDRQALPEISNDGESDNKLRFFEIRVSEVTNPYKFWVQLGSEYCKLDQMMQELDDFYEMEEQNYCMPDMTIRRGQVCAATYELGARWHRTLVLSTCGALEVKIEYVDYGTICRVAKSKLRFLHKDFIDLPMQAIQAKLASVLPPPDHVKWPIQSSRKLLDMVTNKVLFFETTYVDRQDGVPVLEGVLYDTNGNTDVIINDELVNCGYAKFIEDTNDELGDVIGKELLGEVILEQEDEDDVKQDSYLDLVDEDKEKEVKTFGPGVTKTDEVSENEVADIFHKSYSKIHESLPDLPFGQKENAGVKVTKPPPGFTPLTGGAASGYGASTSSLVSKSSAMTNYVDLMLNMFMAESAKAVGHVGSNFAGTLFNQQHHQQPAATPANRAPFQDVNAASLWNEFTAGVGNTAPPSSSSSSSWYNQSGCAPFPPGVVQPNFQQQFFMPAPPQPTPPPPPPPQPAAHYQPCYGQTNFNYPFLCNPAPQNFQPPNSGGYNMNAYQPFPPAPPQSQYVHQQFGNANARSQFVPAAASYSVPHSLNLWSTAHPPGHNNSRNRSETELTERVHEQQTLPAKVVTVIPSANNDTNCDNNIHLSNGSDTKTGDDEVKSNSNANLDDTSANLVPVLKPIPDVKESVKMKKRKKKSRQTSRVEDEDEEEERKEDVTSCLSSVPLRCESANSNSGGDNRVAETDLTDKHEELRCSPKSCSISLSSIEPKTLRRPHKLQSLLPVTSSHLTTDAVTTNKFEVIDPSSSSSLKMSKSSAKIAESSLCPTATTETENAKICTNERGKEDVVDSWEELADDYTNHRPHDNENHAVTLSSSTVSQTAWIWGPPTITNAVNKPEITTDNSDPQSKTDKTADNPNNVPDLVKSSNSVLTQYLNISDWKSLNDEKIGFNTNKTVTNDSGDVLSRNSALIDANSNTLTDRTTNENLSSVIKKVVGDKTVHVICYKESQTDVERSVVATDELVKLFTRFSKRHALTKVLDSKGIDKPFYDLHKKQLPRLFSVLENCSLDWSVKKTVGDKLNVVPLIRIPDILESLSIDRSVVNNFHKMMDEFQLH